MSNLKGSFSSTTEFKGSMGKGEQYLVDKREMEALINKGIQDINDEGTTQVSNVNQAGTSAVSDVNTAKDNAVGAVGDAEDEAVEHIGELDPLLIGEADFEALATKENRPYILTVEVDKNE